MIPSELSWKDSFKNGLRSIEQVNQFFNISLKEMHFDNLIPLHLAYRIKEQGLDGILAKQFLPSNEEIADHQEDGLNDPIGDQNFSRPGQIIHRYKNRALFLPTTVCPVVCRYCFRKNELSNNDEIFKSDFQKTLEYFENHPEIEEIIFSGGDPLMLSNEKLESYLNSFSKIKHIKYIRLHSRTPISLPQRIDTGLTEVLKMYANTFETLSIAIHVNHKEEIDADVTAAMARLREIQSLNLLSQTVLLKGINDCPNILEDLFKKINRLGIRPYYLHHPDKVKGGMHFQLDIKAGRIIYANLRDKLPGWLIPQYVLDIPGGYGKTPLFNPEALEFSGVLINYKSQQIKL